MILCLSWYISYFHFSLLKQAQTTLKDNCKGSSELPIIKGPSFPSTGSNTGSRIGNMESSFLEEKQLLGRYGVWLLIGLCKPDDEIPAEILGRLLSMLFHWFHITAYSFDGTEKSLIHLIFSVGKSHFIYTTDTLDYGNIINITYQFKYYNNKVFFCLHIFAL